MCQPELEDQNQMSTPSITHLLQSIKKDLNKLKKHMTEILLEIQAQEKADKVNEKKADMANKILNDLEKPDKDTTYIPEL